MFVSIRITRPALLSGMLLASAVAAAGSTGSYTPIGSFGFFVANRPGEFGTALSAFGSSIAVGAPHMEIPGTPPTPDVGRVFVHRNEDGVWIENSFAIISPPAANRQSGMEFGAAVAISGNDMIVGAPGEDVNGLVDAGAVYFYRRDDLGNFQFRERNDSGVVQAGQRFGASVAITGTYAAAGSPLYNQNSQTVDTGRVTLYLRSSDAGSYLQNGGEMTPSPQGFEAFGSSLHFQDFLFGTDRLFIGAPNRVVSGVQLAGSAYFYERISGSWDLQQTIAPAIATGDFVGSALASSGDFLFVGTRGRDAPGGIGAAGSVRVYLMQGSGLYAFDDELFASAPQASAFFGSSLAVSGPRLVVGAPQHNQGAIDSGSAHVFERQMVAGDTFYIERGALALAEPPASDDRLGTAVAVVGNVVFASAPGRTVRDFPDAGLVQLYSNETVFADGFEEAP